MGRFSHSINRTALIAYSLAAVALVVAVLLRWLLDPMMGDALPLVTLFGAVAAAVWIGGYRPAVLVAVLGYVACAYLFIPPRGSLDFDDAGHAVGLVAYLFTCGLIIAIGEAMRVAQFRAAQRRELLRVTLQSIGDAVITTDVAGRITYLNRVAELLTGWTLQESFGRQLETVFRIVNEKTREPVENPATKALAHGVVVGLANHTLLIRKDGSEQPIEDSAAPIRDEKGRVSGCVLIFRDATEQRKLEHERADQFLTARRLATIVESSDDAIISKSLEGMIQTWNAAAERLFGYTAEEAIGRHISLVIPPDRIAEEDRIIASLKAGQRIDHFETERIRRDGQRVLVSLTVSPIKNVAGQVIGASKIVRDITQQRQAEERERNDRMRAEAEREKFVTLIESSTDFIGMCDLNGIPFFINRAGMEMVGLDILDQARATPVKEFFFPEDQDRIMNEFFPSILKNGHGEIEVRFRHFKTGVARWMAYKVLKLTDSAGQPVAFATVSQDISERRRMEDDLRKLAENLSEADRRKDEFLATLAHELRNPLAPMRNALQIIRLSPDRAAREEARKLMERQLEQMVRLVDDLLDVGRITRGRLELRKEPVELSSVVASAVETSRPLIDYMGHELTVTQPDQSILVDADLTRLAQVFANLLNNSAKYMERGGHIWLTVEPDGSEVVVSVKDAGIGIAADQMPRIFEMFSQADQALERSQGGLGIGLTLVKRLVEMHDGRIDVKSEGLGKGAEFVVRLPFSLETSAPQNSSPRLEPESAKSSTRVLIVDDNHDSADSLAMLLRIMGYDTRTAYDGQAGVDVAQEFRPAVILLDIGLPKLNGYEACRQIRGQPWGMEIVLIAVTGWGQEEDRRQSRSAGFDMHMVKPVDPQELVTRLAELQLVRS